MSIHIHTRSERQQAEQNGFTDVIGYVLAAVVKNREDGSVTLERDISVHADNFEDNQLAEQVVKDLQAKFEEIFPDPNKPQPSKLWVPE